MAFAGIDNFESYSVAALNGNNGGSGWSAAWSDAGNHYNVVSTPTNTGSRAVANTSNTSGSSQALRSFTAASSGTLYVSMQASNTTASQAGILFNDGATNNRVLLLFNNTAGNISYFDGTVYQVLQAFSANTWYRIGFEWDNAGHPNQVRYNVNNGAWTAWSNVNGNFTTLDGVYLYYDSTGLSFYWDDISNVYAPATTTVLPYRALLGVGI